MVRLSYPIEMEIAGNTAMWTRPDTGDCPVSYPAPTYSAVKAIFESILWGPDIKIIPTKVELCAPVQYHSYCTNYGGPLRKPKDIKGGNNYQLYASVLIDVCYRIYADVIPNKEKSKLPERAKQWDKKTTSPGHAYQAIFTRRLKRGQCYSIPALGWREFTPSYFGEFRDATKVMTDFQPLIIPSMLRQVFPNGYNSSVSYVYDNNLVLQEGVLEYPKRGVDYDK
ncbi:MAG TPA: CRISPR-associated protein Cas5 [Bacillales bacterium]|nr:CRISPR-associated protein Cas5 [Bacillales bacterium]